MKSLKIVCTILICTFCLTLYAQVDDAKGKQEALALFNISRATENGNDITQIMTARDFHLTLYKIEDIDNLQFTSICKMDDSQIYGPIYSIVKDVDSDIDGNLKSELYHFYWSYNKTYNTERGTAKIKLFVVYKPQETYYELTMRYENLDEFVYTGVIEGDLSPLACETKIKR